MKKVVTKNHKIHVARQLLESITEPANTSYYFFLGEHVPRADSTVPDIYDNNRQTYIDVYRNMIMGKKIKTDDMSLMVRNIPYEDNKVFAYYDDQDTNLYSKDYFCVVSEGIASSYRHVFLCLDNNNNSPSQVPPDFSHITGSNTVLYETSDGYRWKYLYSVSSSLVKKFGSTEYIPYVANNIVIQNAVDGAVDVIKVSDGGRGYDNYITGTLTVNDINPAGQSNLYRIANSNAKPINDFYKGCLFYVAEGTNAGQFANVTTYVNNTSGNFITLDRIFTPKLDSTSAYEIYPNVKIAGDGSQTINAVARALVNATSSNSVYKIEILERGKGYDYFEASVVPPAENSNNVLKEAVLTPIFSPPGGHGFDAAQELGASKLCISVTFRGTESNTILTKNEFQQVGILHDPLFDNVLVSYSNSYGTPLTGELFYVITPKRFETGVSTNSLSANISSNNAYFTNQVIPGDLIYIKNEAGTRHMLNYVKTVHSNTVIELVSNALFDSVNSAIHYANSSAFAFCSNVEPNGIYFSNVSGIISSGDKMIGFNTGAYIEANSVTRNGADKGFDTFIQLYKHEVDSTNAGSFAFEENEYLYQGNLASGPNAYLHSTESLGGNQHILYTSRQFGTFEVGDEIYGNTSGSSVFLINTLYPELVYGSGLILYVENVEPISRSNTQTETFKIIFDF